MFNLLTLGSNCIAKKIDEWNDFILSLFLFSHLLKLLLWESYKQAKSDIREMTEIVQGLFIQSTTKYPYDLKTRS